MYAVVTKLAEHYIAAQKLYETTVNLRRQQPMSRVSARLSERYEFSEPHLATALVVELRMWR